MAVNLDFSITQSCNCKTLTFKELTGAYDAITNVTGWGAPNEATSDAISAYVNIETPTGSSIIFALDDFPTSDTCTVTADITGTAGNGIGLNSNFPSGLYEFQYVVITGTTTYTRTRQMYLYCTLKCCVDKLFANINFEDCECNDPQIDEALLALALLRGLAYHVSVANYTEADAIKTKLTNLCANSQYCNNC
jgi:hypothetical protein